MIPHTTSDLHGWIQCALTCYPSISSHRLAWLLDAKFQSKHVSKNKTEASLSLQPRTAIRKRSSVHIGELQGSPNGTPDRGKSKLWTPSALRSKSFSVQINWRGNMRIRGQIASWAIAVGAMSQATFICQVSCTKHSFTPGAQACMQMYAGALSLRYWASCHS
jgi:hypothetical protein